MTETEGHLGRVGLRRDIAMSTMSVDPIRSLVWRVLLFEGEGWTARGLAAYVHRPVETIRRKVRDLAAAGVIEKRDGRIYLSEYGGSICARLHSETLEIAAGRQAGYSRDIQEASAKISPLSPDASTISFPDRYCLKVKLSAPKWGNTPVD